MLEKTYFDNDPDEDGTQLVLSHSLSVEQQETVERLNADYSQDDLDEGVFVNVGKDDVDKVKLLLQEWGFSQEASVP